MKKCKVCGSTCNDEEKFCRECGYKFEEETVVNATVEEEKVVESNEDIFASKLNEDNNIVECPTCGALVDVKETQNCPVCGALLTNVKPVSMTGSDKANNANKTNVLAIIGFICGIASMLLSGLDSMYWFITPGIAAIVLGIICLAKKLKGKSKVFGILALVFGAYAIVSGLIYVYVLGPALEQLLEKLNDELDSIGLLVKMLFK